jgi:hypothetical protein
MNARPALYDYDSRFPTPAQERAEEARALKVAERFTALWADPEVLSEVVTDLPALTYRRKAQKPESYPRADDFRGIAALTALRDGDHAEFGRLVHKAMVDAVQALADQQIDDETPDPEFDL